MSLPGEFGGKSFLLASVAIGLSAGMTATLFYHGNYDLALTVSAALVGGAALLMLGLRAEPRPAIDCPAAPSMSSIPE